jgi:anthranilate synthase component 1
MLAAVEALAHLYTSPYLPELPPLQGGVMGYLGYDIVREIEHLPNVPKDDRGLPDSVMAVIGSLAAFDHWRQRVYMIESVPLLGVDDLDAAYERATETAMANAVRLSQPL